MPSSPLDLLFFSFLHTNKKYLYHILVYLRPHLKLFHLTILNCLKMVAIHKGDAISNPNNYRGITINSCLSKVFNSILNNRLVEFLNVNSIMKDEQIGFLKVARTADHNC
jgi:hypothetical protein